MNVEQLTPQTAEQHRIAQEAGNAAYESVFDTSGKGRWNLRSATEAYQLAYQTSLAEQQGVPRPGYIVNPAAQMSETQDAAAYKMVEYLDWQHGERGAGCAGNSADEYDSSTEGHW